MVEVLFDFSMMILSIWFMAKVFAQKGHGIGIKVLTTFTTALWMHIVWSDIAKLIQ